MAQVSSNHDNQGERFTHRIVGQTIMKPLMFFCFDIMDENTVALTCPKVELKKPINRCCDLTDPTDECTDENWELPINGHLFNDSVKWTNNKVGLILNCVCPALCKNRTA